MRGTTKGAILKVNPNYSDLVATSVYDTKPLHYLSMSSEELKWVVCEKYVYNVDTDAKEPLQFLQMCCINKYNHQMGDMDVADQLRNNYRFDHWIRKRKWSWSIMFWGIGVILVNACIIYRRVKLEAGVSKSYLLLHHNFCKNIEMAWISPNIYWSTEIYGQALSTWKKEKCFNVQLFIS